MELEVSEIRRFDLGDHFEVSLKLEVRLAVSRHVLRGNHFRGAGDAEAAFGDGLLNSLADFFVQGFAVGFLTVEAAHDVHRDVAAAETVNAGLLGIALQAGFGAGGNGILGDSDLNGTRERVHGSGEGAIGNLGRLGGLNLGFFILYFFSFFSHFAYFKKGPAPERIRPKNSGGRRQRRDTALPISGLTAETGNVRAHPLQGPVNCRLYFKLPGLAPNSGTRLTKPHTFRREASPLSSPY